MTDYVSSTIAPTNHTDWKFEDPVQRKIVGALLLFIGFSGLIGNAIVIIAFVLSERLQNITNVFVINLAVSDLLSSTLSPFFVQNVLTENEELLPKQLCAMVGILVYVFVSSSIINHAVIAINRYWRVSRPVSAYRKLFSPKRIVFILVLIWTYSSIIPLATHFSGFIAFGYNSKYRICSLDVNDDKALFVASLRAVVVDVVCLVIVVIFYCKFFLFIKRHSNEMMHLYSTERKISDSSTSQRFSDDDGPNRSVSVMTRIVNMDDAGVETVLHNPKPVWRQMSHSVSESAITSNGVTNESFTKESFTKEIIEDEDADCCVDEDDIQTSHENEELSESSESTERKVKPNLCAISENSELASVANTTNVNDDIGHSGSTEGANIETEENDRPNSGVEMNNVYSNKNNNEARTPYRKERNSSSASPTHIATNRRRISELVHKSFFGRSSSVSSTSERVKCMQVRLNRRQIRITKNLFVVVCAFLICVSQYVIFLVIPSLEQLLPYSAVLLTLSHTINPLIYAIKHPTFHAVIQPMLRCNLSKIPGPSKALKAILRK